MSTDNTTHVPVWYVVCALAVWVVFTFIAVNDQVNKANTRQRANAWILTQCERRLPGDQELSYLKKKYEILNHYLEK